VAGGLVGYWNAWKTVRTDVLQEGKRHRERPRLGPLLLLACRLSCCHLRTSTMIRSRIISLTVLRLT
jgi:hypothetical protein